VPDKPDKSDKGNFVWYEHLTTDPKAAVDFYTEVVGWKTEPFADGNDYLMWVGGQGPLGGVMQLPEEGAEMGAPPHWLAHVQVENVDAAAAQAKKLGGKVHKEPEDIPDVGRFAVIGDPQGAFISIFQPKEAMTLHDPSKPGEFCWNELMTSDFAAAFDFYSQLFGWKVSQVKLGPTGRVIIITVYRV